MNILEKVVESKRLPILFIGSGISKRYLNNYPDWTSLLELSFQKFEADPFQFQKHKEALQRSGLSDFEVNIELGNIIEDQFNQAFFDRKFSLNIGDKKNPRWVKRGISPFKMFLSDYFKRMPITKREDLLSEIDKFKQLKNKVSAVITTNYDLFLERVIFPEDYSIFVHQEDLFGADSYNIAEIYKIHGSASDANSIVITKRDYDRFNDSRKLIIAKMLTLFAESPIIFMGYSFTDENIQNIISDFLGCLSPAQLESISEHFIFISYKKDERDLVEIRRTIITREKKEIPITEIQTDNFPLVFDTLNRIIPGISPVRVRETKRVIKTIVDASISSDNAESVIVGLDDLDNMSLSGKPLAIAIGYRESILSKVGYGFFDDILILEDIIFNNKNFDAQAMCFERYKSIAVTRLCPVFKYVKKCESPIPEAGKLYNYMQCHNSVDKILSNNIKKSLKNVPSYDTLEVLSAEIDKQESVNKKAGLLLKNIQQFSPEEIRELCKKIFQSDPEQKELKTSTNFKRCVMYLDFVENYE